MTIISYSKNFIFTKTNKTAGTSLEIALSKYCDDGDVIGLIGDDEKIRRDLGFRTAQNYKGKLSKKINLGFFKGFLAWLISKSFLNKYFHFRYPPTIFNKLFVENIIAEEHFSISKIQKLVGNKFYENSKKITIVRNPYTQILSYYHWQLYRNKISPDTTIYDFVKDESEFFFNNEISLLKNLQGKINFDLVIKYEEIENGIKKLSQIINIKDSIYDIFKNIKAKGGLKKKYDQLDEKSVEIVNDKADFLFKNFGYKKKQPI